MSNFQQEEKGIIKPVIYKAVSFNMPELLFWSFKEYVLNQKSNAKVVFNKAVNDFLTGNLSVDLQGYFLQEERQKYNIQIQIEYIDTLKKIAIDNRLKLTDIYISILKAIV